MSKITPESSVTNACIYHAGIEGWMCIRNSQGPYTRGKASGRPDWELIKPFHGLGISIHVEFKGPKGKLSEAQKDYHRRLIGAKCLVITARSLDEFKLDLQRAEQIIRERLAI